MAGFYFLVFFRKRFFATGLFSFLFIAFCSSQQIPAAIADGPWGYGVYTGAGASFYAKNLNSGQVLLDYNSHLSLTPASSMKAITAAAAIELLPTNWKFTSVIEIHGNLKDGVLKGDLIFKGSGDPSLGSRYSPIEADELLIRWANAVQQAGIKKITGSVIADASCCGDQYVADTWPWYDIGNYYGSGAGCINWRDNSYDLQFERRRTAAATDIVINGTNPYVPGLHHTHTVTAAGTRDLAYIYGGPGQFVRTVRGSIPAGTGLFTIRGSLPDPALQLAFELYQALKNCNIEVEQSYRSSHQPVSSSRAKKILVSHESAAPGLFYDRIMKHSDNLYSEAVLLKTAQFLNADCSTKEAATALTAFWKSKPGLNNTGIFLEDGSGLSPQNGTSAAFLAGVLEWMHKSSGSGPAFLEIFPIAGKDGTVRNWMQNSPAGSIVYVKSGSMTRVQSYAGYVVQSNGETIVFSLIVNNFEGGNANVRRDLERLLRKLIR